MCQKKSEKVENESFIHGKYEIGVQHRWLVIRDMRATRGSRGENGEVGICLALRSGASLVLHNFAQTRACRLCVMPRTWRNILPAVLML